MIWAVLSATLNIIARYMAVREPLKSHRLRASQSEGIF